MEKAVLPRKQTEDQVYTWPVHLIDGERWLLRPEDGLGFPIDENQNGKSLWEYWENVAVDDVIGTHADGTHHEVFR